MVDKTVGVYTIAEEIGRGSFAIVSKAFHMKTNRVVAVKSVLRSKLTTKLLQNLESEITILKALTHPHIVQLIDCQQSTDYIHLIMEYCALGDLSQFIKRRNRFTEIYGEELGTVLAKYPSGRGGGLNEALVKHFLRQLGAALRFLRSKNLIHRDIKPQNLLLVPPANPGQLPLLKLADFGFARFLPKTSLAETLCGSPLYMAPEILRYKAYGPEVDLWSVGTVLYEMLTSRPPFRAQNHVDLLRRIDKAEDRIKFPGDDDSTGNGGVSEEMKKLCRGLLKRDPEERKSVMGFDTFFVHPCVVEDIAEEQQHTPSALELRLSEAQRRFSGSRATPSVNSHIDSSTAVTGVDDFISTKQNQQSSPVAHLYKGTRRISPDPLAAATTHYQRPMSGYQPRSIISPGTTTDKQIQNPFYSSSPNTRHAPEPDRRLNHTRPQKSTSSQFGSGGEKKDTPGSSFLVQQQQRAATGQQYNHRPRTPEEDVYTQATSSLEREYVMVESRKAVEVNELADAIAHSPQQRRSVGGMDKALIHRAQSNIVGGNLKNINNSGGTGARRATAEQQRSVSAPVYSPVITGGSPTSGQGYISSERRFGTSPSGALAKAISIASMRLFGGSPSPTNYDMRNALVKVGGGSVEEEFALKEIEELALRSNVIYQLAEMKLSQILHSQQTFLPTPSSSSSGAKRENLSSESNSLLTKEASVALCEEALVLYVKSLSILQKCMDLAGRYWAHKFGGNGVAPKRLNDAVQWGRERFNESLEKAEFVKARLGTGNASESGEGVVTAEKLIYDRALEMSRAAAVNELVGEDLHGCETSYETAIIMLEAILEPSLSTGRESEPASEIGHMTFREGMDEEDKRTVEKFIQSIKRRLDALRKKLNYISQRQSPTPPAVSEKNKLRRLSGGSSSSVNAMRGESPISPGSGSGGTGAGFHNGNAETRLPGHEDE